MDKLEKALHGELLQEVITDILDRPGVDLEVEVAASPDQAQQRATTTLDRYYEQHRFRGDVFPVVGIEAQDFVEVRSQYTAIHEYKGIRLPVAVQDRHYFMVDSTGRLFHFVDHEDCMLPNPDFYRVIAEQADEVIAGDEYLSGKEGARDDLAWGALVSTLDRCNHPGDHFDGMITMQRECAAEFCFALETPIRPRAYNPMHCYIAGIDPRQGKGREIVIAAMQRMLHQEITVNIELADLVDCYDDETLEYASLLDILPLRAYTSDDLKMELVQRLTEREVADASPAFYRGLLSVLSRLGRDWNCSRDGDMRYVKRTDLFVSGEDDAVYWLAASLLRLSPEVRERILGFIVDCDLLDEGARQGLANVVNYERAVDETKVRPDRRVSASVYSQLHLEDWLSLMSWRKMSEVPRCEDIEPRFASDRTTLFSVNGGLPNLPYIPQVSIGGYGLYRDKFEDHAVFTPLDEVFVERKKRHDYPRSLSFVGPLLCEMTAADWVENSVGPSYRGWTEALATVRNIPSIDAWQYDDRFPSITNGGLMSLFRVDNRNRDALRELLYWASFTGSSIGILELIQQIAAAEVNDTVFCDGDGDSVLLRGERVLPYSVFYSRLDRINRTLYNIRTGLNETIDLERSSNARSIGEIVRILSKDPIGETWVVDDYSRTYGVTGLRMEEGWQLKDEYWGDTPWYRKDASSTSRKVLSEWLDQNRIEIACWVSKDTSDNNKALGVYFFDAFLGRMRQLWSAFTESIDSDEKRELIGQLVDVSQCFYEVTKYSAKGVFCPILGDCNLLYYYFLPIRDFLAKDSLVPIDIPPLGPGSVVNLFGHNGAGKSTALRSIIWSAQNVFSGVPQLGYVDVVPDVLSLDTVSQSSWQMTTGSLFTGQVRGLNRILEPKKSEGSTLWPLDELGRTTSSVYAMAIALTFDAIASAKGDIVVAGQHNHSLSKYEWFLRHLGADPCNYVTDCFKLREMEPGERLESLALGAIAKYVPRDQYEEEWPCEEDLVDFDFANEDPELGDLQRDELLKLSRKDSLRLGTDRNLLSGMYGIDKELETTFLSQILNFENSEIKAEALERLLEIDDEVWKRMVKASDRMRAFQSIMQNREVDIISKAAAWSNLVSGRNCLAVPREHLEDLARACSFDENGDFDGESYRNYIGLLTDPNFQEESGSTRILPLNIVIDLLGEEFRFLTAQLNDRLSSGQLRCFNLDQIQELAEQLAYGTYISTLRSPLLSFLFTTMRFVDSLRRRERLCTVELVDQDVFTAAGLTHPSILKCTPNDVDINLARDLGVEITGENGSGKTVYMWKQVIAMIEALSFGMASADSMTLGRNIVPLSFIQPLTDESETSSMQVEVRDKIARILSALQGDYPFIVYYDEPGAATSSEDSSKIIQWIQGKFEREGQRTCMVYTTHSMVPRREGVKYQCFKLLSDDQEDVSDDAFKAQDGRGYSNALNIARHYGLNETFYQVATLVERMIRETQEDERVNDEVQRQYALQVQEVLASAGLGAAVN